MTCESVAHRLCEIDADATVLEYVNVAPGAGRLRYTYAFWDAFADRWCPTGAANDPAHLNSNWLHNAYSAYVALWTKPPT